MTVQEVGSTTIHRCAECGHADNHHEGSNGQKNRVGPCGYGGCACRLTPEAVREANPAVTIPTYQSWRPR